MTASGLLGVSADPRSRELADQMLAMDDVMAEILDETIPSGKGEQVTESGRTYCSQSGLHGPLARFPTSVELATCPRGVNGGTWHTHVTKEQLRNPANSLPDTANVIFGEVDVSIVVGTRGAEAVMGAEDPEAARRTFQDAIGTEVQTPGDVVDAVISREIERPSAARDRVRRDLGGLFSSRRVSFPDLDSRLETSGIGANMSVSFEMVEAQQYAMITNRHPGHGGHPHPVREPRAMKQYVRQKNEGVKRAANDLDVKDHAVRSAVSTVVSQGLRSIL